VDANESVYTDTAARERAERHYSCILLRPSVQSRKKVQPFFRGPAARPVWADESELTETSSDLPQHAQPPSDWSSGQVTILTS
jgi:hypothetical protein